MSELSQTAKVGDGLPGLNPARRIANSFQAALLLRVASDIRKHVDKSEGGVLRLPIIK